MTTPAYDANAYLRALYGTDPFTMQIALCDPDGTVRRGMLHRGQDYPCTGSAHVMDEHVRCTSLAHAENVGHCGKPHPWGYSYCMPGCLTVLKPNPGSVEEHRDDDGLPIARVTTERTLAERFATKDADRARLIEQLADEQEYQEAQEAQEAQEDYAAGYALGISHERRRVRLALQRTRASWVAAALRCIDK